jgi:hypothetical protein
VFYARQDTKACEQDSFATRVRSASANAATGVGKGVSTGVYNVRVWAAPRLESAADYTTTTIAPKVSSALRSSANQVRPVVVTKKGHSALTWSLLTAAVLAAAGAVAALVKYRDRAAMMVSDKKYEGGLGDDETVVAGTEGAAPAGPAYSTPGAPGAPGAPAGSATGSADAGVNERASKSGW